MMRASLHWAVPLGVIFVAAACGSSGNTGAGTNGNPSSVGGASGLQGGMSANAGTVGAGNNSISGSGTNGGDGSNNAGSANAGNGSAGDNANAGSGAVSTNGGSDNGDGGNGSAGDSSSVIDGSGGSGSEDVKVTGGGSSIDVGSGGGSSIDVGTGGGNSLDGATGGSSSLDVPTGGSSSLDVPTGGGTSLDVPTGGGTSIDVGTGGGTSVDTGCFVTKLTGVNVYVIKDATPNGADTEGNMLVGGNMTPGVAGYSVGACNTGAASHPCSTDTLTCSSSQYVLVVGGNVSNTIVYGGNAIAGGTITASTDPTCGSFKRGDPASSSFPVDFTALESTVESLSTRLSQLPVSGTVTSGGNLILSCPANQTQAVFNITADQFDNANQITISNNCASSTIIVNVSGTTISKSGGGWALPNGGALCSTNNNKFCEQIVWNMYQATSITMSGIGLQGSLLAPLATLDGAGGDIDGQVIVQYLKGGLEYHPFYFSGCLTWAS